MKVFWSWQSDTPGKVGRHLVRAALEKAIDTLKEESEIEEPSPRDTRDALHLDSDRQGVPGSPDLAATIFRKIENAGIFVADVTLVGSVPQSVDGKIKRMINSNVAIEYGFAQHAVGDERILMVMNTHFGDRDGLPFDLKHKAGPMQFSVAPGAEKSEIDRVTNTLSGDFVKALRPYLERDFSTHLPFDEIPSKASIAVFNDPDESIVEEGVPNVDLVSWRFAPERAFYLRVIPTKRLSEPLRITDLEDQVHQRRLDVMMRQHFQGRPGRNKWGVILFQQSNNSVEPVAFTQVFRSGEMWSATTEMFSERDGHVIVPGANVRNIGGRVLNSCLHFLKSSLLIEPPYTVEIGAVGLDGTVIGLNNADVSGPIRDRQLRYRKPIADISEAAQNAFMQGFMNELLDLAGQRYKGH